jgi:hypothetical protein
MSSTALSLQTSYPIDYCAYRTYFKCEVKVAHLQHTLPALSLLTSAITYRRTSMLCGDKCVEVREQNECEVACPRRQTRRPIGTRQDPLSLSWLVTHHSLSTPDFGTAHHFIAARTFLLQQLKNSSLKAYQPKTVVLNLPLRSSRRDVFTKVSIFHDR